MTNINENEDNSNGRATSGASSSLICCDKWNIAAGKRDDFRQWRIEYKSRPKLPEMSAEQVLLADAERLEEIWSRARPMYFIRDHAWCSIQAFRATDLYLLSLIHISE